tara:strand:- start:453 stop:575 length:123 start_codon:yes stop_codon:yes gene_type:complete
LIGKKKEQSNFTKAKNMVDIAAFAPIDMEVIKAMEIKLKD